MEEGTAIALAKSKAKELNFGKEYIMRYRHLRLEGNGKRTIKADNDLFVFIYPYFNIRIESKRGIYDMKDMGINELQHIHSGRFTIENQSSVMLDAKFLQVIPSPNKKD